MVKVLRHKEVLDIYALNRRKPSFLYVLSCYPYWMQSLLPGYYSTFRSMKCSNSPIALHEPNAPLLLQPTLFW